MLIFSIFLVFIFSALFNSVVYGEEQTNNNSKFQEFIYYNTPEEWSTTENISKIIFHPSENKNDTFFDYGN